MLSGDYSYFLGGGGGYYLPKSTLNCNNVTPKKVYTKKIGFIVMHEKKSTYHHSNYKKEFQCLKKTH